MSDFVPLHVHSHYSLLDGLAKIDELIDQAKKYGYQAMALTDHGVMYGVIEFYQKARQAGIKPIIGCEVYLAPRRMEDKTPKIDTSPSHLVLLVQDQIGYKNLIQLVTQSHLKGHYYKPRIDKDLLKKHSAGLIALTSCLQGEIPRLILAGKKDKAKKAIEEYQAIFGQDNFFLEIQHHPELPEQNQANQVMIELTKETGAPLVASHDSHYLHSEDKEAHEVLLAIQTGKDIDDRRRLSMKEADFSFPPPDFFLKNFKNIPQAMSNSWKIAEKCNLELDLEKLILPHFEVPRNQSPIKYLRELCEKGLAERYPSKDKVARQRLEYELSVIEKTNFADYFLIVQDFINWAKNQGILVGPGRGSASGSIVSYCLNITDLDPLRYNLLFERFLNPERIAPPDIDMDFADDRRDEVIEYVRKKYGSDHVAQIITFGVMKARMAIRDCGRALGMTYQDVDRIAKLIPFGLTIDQTLQQVSDFRNLFQSDPQIKKLIEMTKKLEGVARHASTHAAGVVISQKPLIEYLPLQYGLRADQEIITQYSMYDVEKIGLLKMDFLGLANLTIIKNTLRIIKKTQEKKIEIEKIPLDDKKTYNLLSRAETTGVFQLECLSGETIISNTTIKKLYEKRNKRVLESVYLDEGRVHKNKIIDILYAGKKKVYALITENNWFIKSTKDHYFLTESGWKKLEEIKPGEKILVKTKAKHLVYNTCQTCRKQISGQKEGKSNFCYRCSASFYRNPSKKESREKIKTARIKFYQQGGKPWNYGMTTENNEIWKKTAEKISKALSGRTFEEIYGIKKTKELKKKISQRSKGQNNPMFGKPSPHRKGGFRKDLGHYVRSAWEADFARILKLHNLNYKYEPRVFRLIKPNGEIIHYTPDFYIKSNNTFYEVKGWLHDLDKEKIKLFQEQHPQYNLVMISATKFAELSLKYRDLIKWECPKVPLERSFRFIRVKEIKYHGEEETYDLVMTSPGNNFIASGFVVHNSDGMKRYLKELKPSKIDDIIAMVALYRPGPMELIPDYIAGKHKKKEVIYLHPKLKPILKDTYGIAVFQEQVMQIAQDIAGFTLGEADVLRKAVGKKIKKLLMEQKKKFLEGAIKKGVHPKVAEKLFSFIEPFARYGFNKCLPGDTEIVNPTTGEIFTLKEIYKNPQLSKTVLSCDNHFQLIPKKISKVIDNGFKPVYEITTRLGKKIKATSNHPFLTIKGWRILKNLKTGEKIALARYLPLRNQKFSQIKTHQLILLGYLLAEGNLCHPAGFYFYSTDQEELNDYLEALKKFKNTTGKIDFAKKAVSIYAKRIDLKKESEAVKWIEKLGLKNKKATQKEFPSFVWRLNQQQLALLLGKLFQGDGCINLKRKNPQIFYATSSEKLARQLQHLLLRLGIISTLHKKNFKYRKKSKVGFTLTISGYSNLQNFISFLEKHLIGKKKITLQKIYRNHPILNKKLGGLVARGTKDIIPSEIREIIREEIKKKGFTFREFAQRVGIAPRLFWKDKRKKGYRRETIEFIGRVLNSPILLDYAHSQFYWDEIVSVKPRGKTQTYDLTVESTHNFVANDFLVHNSHAASYALIAYQTAYLKAHWPAEFMAALLTSDFHNLDRIAIEIPECERLGIKVLPPDVNQSFVEFGVIKESGQISFGLAAIKNVGLGAAEAIVEERKKNGPYQSLEDFLTRLGPEVINKKVIESLARAGTLDDFAERNQILAGIDQILKFSSNLAKQTAGGQVSLFEMSNVKYQMPNLTLPKVELADKKQRLAWERELLGIYLSDHPLKDFQPIIESQAQKISSLSPQEAGREIKIGGIITDVKKIITKSSEPMLFVKIEDTTANTEVVVFPKTLKENYLVWQPDNIVLIKGRINTRDGLVKVIAEKAEEIGEQMTLEATKELVLNLNKKTDKKMLNQIKTILLNFPGVSPVNLSILHDGEIKKIKTKTRVNISQKLLDSLTEILGEDRIEVG